MTILGTDAADTLLGTGGDDRVKARGGDDVVRAGEGADTIMGGDGDDAINAGGGDDRIDGGRGDDAVTAGLGDDRLEGGEGDDILSGGEGDDTLFGGEGHDKFYFGPAGGAQRDVIRDFDPAFDVIEFDETSIVKAVQHGSDVVITLTSGGRVVVENTRIGELSDASFNEGVEGDFYVGAVTRGAAVTGELAARPATVFDHSGEIKRVYNDANPEASDYYSFTLAKGASVTIAATSVDDDFDPAIWLLRDKVNLEVGKFGLFFALGDRNVIATADDTSGGGADDGTAALTFVAPQSGTYSVVVTDAGSDPASAGLSYAYELLLV